MSFFKAMLAGTLSMAVLLGCEAPANALDPNQVLGRGRVLAPPGPIPAGTTSGSPSGEAVPSAPAIGDTCRGSDPKKICLGLKYVVYRDSTGNPIVSTDTTIKNVRAINTVWSQCNLGFQVDEYVAVKPADYQLRYQTGNYSELEDIRSAFEEDSSLLLVTTGTWDRSGTLGNSSANAWTAMPGGPFGAILERPVGSFANIIAHELGHYLNLYHVSDATDIMNPIIYSTSTKLTPAQCSTARSAASFFWSKMYR